METLPEVSKEERLSEELLAITTRMKVPVKKRFELKHLPIILTNKFCHKFFKAHLSVCKTTIDIVCQTVAHVGQRLLSLV